jgi:hypothetical protein
MQRQNKKKAPSNDVAFNYCTLKTLYMPFDTKVIKEIIFPITYPTNLKMQSIIISKTSNTTNRPNTPRMVSNLIHQLTSVLSNKSTIQLSYYQPSLCNVNYWI